MKTYRITFREVDRHLYDDVAEGRKTIETRAATVKYKPIQPGDHLVFACGKDTFDRTVTDVRHFPSIEAMLEELPLQNIIPTAKTIDDARKIYYSFPGYREKIAAEGILAFILG